MEGLLLVVGESVDLAVELVARRGVSRGGVVMLVYGSGRAARVFGEFARRFLRGVSYRAVEVPELEFWEAAAWFARLLAWLCTRCRSVVVGLVGGQVLECLAGVALAGALGFECESVYVARGGVLEELPPRSVAALSSLGSIRPLDVETLLALRECSTAMELSRALGLEVSSVGRRLRRLERAGLVESEGSRPRRFRLTVTGRALVSIASSTRGTEADI